MIAQLGAWLSRRRLSRELGALHAKVPDGKAKSSAILAAEADIWERHGDDEMAELTRDWAEAQERVERGEVEIWEVHSGWGDHISFMTSATIWRTQEGMVLPEDQKLVEVYAHLPPRFDGRPRFPRLGDQLWAAMKSGRTGVYEFRQIQPQDEPEDMLLASVWPLGYLEDVAV